MRSRHFTLIGLVFALFLSGPIQAATLVVKLAATQADEAYVNSRLAVPAGLLPGHHYHVTLGFVVNVPKSQAKKLKRQLYAFLKHAHNAKKDPIRFNVGKASTWGMEGNPYYGANTVILLPSNPQIFNSLNARLAAYLAPLRSQGIGLDQATSPQHYVAHISMRSPKSANPAAAAAQAVNQANQYLASHSVHVRLYEYRISIQ